LVKAEKRLSEKKGSTVSSLVDGIERQSFGDDLLDRDAITVLKELEGAMAGVEQSAEDARKKVSDLEAELAELPKRREELSKQFNSNTDATYDAIANRKKASDEAKKVLGNLSADIFGDGSETNRAILEGWLISLGLDEGSVK
jgi:cell division septum initiation protein DivIVA